MDVFDVLSQRTKIHYHETSETSEVSEVSETGETKASVSVGLVLNHPMSNQTRKKIKHAFTQMVSQTLMDETHGLTCFDTKLVASHISQMLLFDLLDGHDILFSVCNENKAMICSTTSGFYDDMLSTLQICPSMEFYQYWLTSMQNLVTNITHATCKYDIKCCCDPLRDTSSHQSCHLHNRLYNGFVREIAQDTRQLHCYSSILEEERKTLQSLPHPFHSNYLTFPRTMTKINLVCEDIHMLPVACNTNLISFLTCQIKKSHIASVHDYPLLHFVDRLLKQCGFRALHMLTLVTIATCVKVVTLELVKQKYDDLTERVNKAYDAQLQQKHCEDENILAYHKAKATILTHMRNSAKLQHIFKPLFHLKTDCEHQLSVMKTLVTMDGETNERMPHLFSHIPQLSNMPECDTVISAMKSRIAAVDDEISKTKQEMLQLEEEITKERDICKNIECRVKGILFHQMDIWNNEECICL